MELVNKGMQINKLNSLHLICANMNALVLPRLIFILSYLKWIKVLFVYKLILKYSQAGYQSDIKKSSIITDVNSKPRSLNRMWNIKILSFILTPDQLIVLL